MEPARPAAAASAPQDTGALNDSAVNDGKSQASDPHTEVERPDGDRMLVARVQKGDLGAYRELFDRYHRRAFAVALGVVKNRQDAQDVVQEAFIKVHRHIATFQGNSSFYTWLYRIVMNLSIDHIRRGRPNTDFDDARAHDDAAGDGSMLPRILDGHPAKNAERRELEEQLTKALDELPEYHRAVILLREIEGLSYEEMAKMLKVPKGTIMSRLFHARKKMQETLKVYLDGDMETEG
jgi:RNA polymerase sigma-70 factor (ECF subfamily)